MAHLDPLFVFDLHTITTYADFLVKNYKHINKNINTFLFDLVFLVGIGIIEDCLF